MIFFNTINLPRNPNSGGSPPSDINTKTIKIFSRKGMVFTWLKTLQAWEEQLNLTPTKSKKQIIINMLNNFRLAQSLDKNHIKFLSEDRARILLSLSAPGSLKKTIINHFSSQNPKRSLVGELYHPLIHPPVSDYRKQRSSLRSLSRSWSWSRVT